MKGHGLGPWSLDWTEYADFVQQVCWGMRNILSLSAQSCSALGYSGPISFRAHKTMQQFMWQDDKIGVAKFVNACLQKMSPCEGQTSDQPGVAGRDVI